MKKPTPKNGSESKGSRGVAAEFSDEEIANRRDAAIGRALSTPPKPLKEYKKGRIKKPAR